MASFSGFNPAALMNIESSLDHDCEVVAAGEEDLRRISGADVRRKCAGVKLASRIIGMAMLGGGEEDAEVLSSMQLVISRMEHLRKLMLAAIGVERSAPDYPVVFNTATNVVMDVLTEEWKWSRLNAEVRPLSGELLGKLFEMAATDGPDYFDVENSGDLKTIRRLCVLEAIPKLWGVVNMFDYYQPSHEKMIAQLVGAVADQAEVHAKTLYSDASPSFSVRAIVQRLYGVSVGLMCEIYKEVAAHDVSSLRAMPDLDRSVMLAQVEKNGMKYDHIIARHRSVMNRTLDTTRLILAAQVEPRRSMESNYGT